LMNHEAGHSLNRLRIVEAGRGVLRRALALLIPAIVLGCHWDQTIHSLARVVAALVFVVMWVTQYPNRFRKVDDEVIADNFALRHAPDEILSHLLALHPSQRTRTDPEFPPHDRTLGDTNDNRRERFWQQVDARRSNRLIAGWPEDSIKPDRTRAVVILICLTTVAYLGNPRSPVWVLAVFGVGCVLAIAELLRVLEKDRRSEAAMESMLARSKRTSRG
jgi:hypothetical protein